MPKRVTWTATLGRDDVSDRMGPNNIVIGWKNANQILFRSRRTEWNDFRGQLYLASAEGGPLEELPLPRGGFGSFSPDGKQFVYNRVFREFRTWKRYRGGQADDVWLHDFGTKTTTNLTNNPAQDIIPMWKGSKVYFASDRDERGRMNLYSYDLGSKQTKKLTTFTEFDVKFPSMGDTAIVFENGGWIYKLDLASEKADEDAGAHPRGLRPRAQRHRRRQPQRHQLRDRARRQPRAVRRARRRVHRAGEVRAHAQPDPDAGHRTSATPSGRPTAGGSRTSRTPPARTRSGSRRRTAGARPCRSPRAAATTSTPLVWSPDSKKLMWSDRRSGCTSSTSTRRPQRRSPRRRPSRSPTTRGRRTAAGSRSRSPKSKGPQRIYLYSLETKQTIAATDAWYASAEPAFSADGKLLYFVSARSFSPTYGQTEFQHIYTDMSRIYFVTLAKDTKTPFAPKSDEVKIKEEPKACGRQAGGRQGRGAQGGRGEEARWDARRSRWTPTA